MLKNSGSVVPVSPNQAALNQSANISRWAGVALALQGATQIASGFSAQRAYSQEASLLQRQADIAQQEAQYEGQRKAREVRQFADQQKEDFLSSGFTGAGSPALILEETRRLGQQEVKAIQRRGYNQARMYNIQAGRARAQGRQAMFGGFLDAGLTGLNAIATRGLLTAKASSKSKKTANPPPPFDNLISVLNIKEPPPPSGPVVMTTGSLG